MPPYTWGLRGRGGGGACLAESLLPPKRLL